MLPVTSDFVLFVPLCLYLYKLLGDETRDRKIMRRLTSQQQIMAKAHRGEYDHPKYNQSEVLASLLLEIF